MCREHLWSMYGNTGNCPPFDPAAIRDLCQQSGEKQSLRIISTKDPNELALESASKVSTSFATGIPHGYMQCFFILNEKERELKCIIIS